MPIATYRGEASVGEIADKVYARMTPSQRTRAEAALLKANPQLAEIGRLRPGTVLRVPEIADLRARTTRDLENPDAQIVDELNAALAAFDKAAGTRVETAQADTKTQSALLKSARFKRDIAQAPALQALAEQAAKALAERAKTLEARQAQVSGAIRRLVTDLKGRGRRGGER